MQHRKRTRLRGYDYSWAGGYFVTICAARRGDFFGRLDGCTVSLSTTGAIVQRHLTERLGRTTGVRMLASVVMPDHVHAVLMLDGTGCGLVDLVNAFKSATTRECGSRIWQRSFHDHVIRKEEDLEQICGYVLANPARAAARRRS